MVPHRFLVDDLVRLFFLPWEWEKVLWVIVFDVILISLLVCPLALPHMMKDTLSFEIYQVGIHIWHTLRYILTPCSLCYHFQSCLVECLSIHLHLMSLKCMQVDATKRGGIARFINHSCEVDIELYEQSLKLFINLWILSW